MKKTNKDIFQMSQKNVHFALDIIRPIFTVFNFSVSGSVSWKIHIIANDKV